MKAKFGRNRPDLLLPKRLRTVFYKLLDGTLITENKRAHYRIATFLCEMERELGINGIRRIMRQTKKLEDAVFKP